MTKLTLPFLLIAVAASAAAAPVPDEAKAPVMFFPTTPVTWVYEYRLGNELVSEVAETVIAVTDQDGMKVVALGTVDAGKARPDDRAVAVSARGLVSGVKPPDGRFVPRATILRVPVVPGEQWAGGRPGGFVPVWRVTTRGPEEVVVPAGRFQAVRVDATYVGADRSQKHDRSWYAPGVGAVRREFDSGVVHVLKRFIRGTHWEPYRPQIVQP